MYDLPEFRMLLSGHGPANGEDVCDIWIYQALAQNALAHHSRTSEQDDVHGLDPRVPHPHPREA
jgi:hypothetical protein